MSADSALQRIWYSPAVHPWSLLLIPLSWLFGALVAVRRGAYGSGLLRSVRVARPVIVIGNVTVGGTGKTPLTIWLATQLQARGLRVGIVLRGYGGRSTCWPREVRRDTSWEEVGDEAVLLAQRTEAIVVGGPDRVAAAQRAIELGAQVVLCDDGLQHYRLVRDCEIVVVDGQRGLGNRRLLPAGPLREPPQRLHEADVVVRTLRTENPVHLEPVTNTAVVTATSRLAEAVSIVNGTIRSLDEFVGQSVHAVAGIGHPDAFFMALRGVGLSIQSHPLPDHARLTRADIVFADSAPVLMTQKDAVKCRAIADERHWAVRMDVVLSAADAASLCAIVDRAITAAAAVSANSPPSNSGPSGS